MLYKLENENDDNGKRRSYYKIIKAENYKFTKKQGSNSYQGS